MWWSELGGSKLAASKVTGLASSGISGEYVGAPVACLNPSTAAEYWLPSGPTYSMWSDDQQVPSSSQVSGSMVVASSSSVRPTKLSPPDLSSTSQATLPMPAQSW